MLTTSVYHCKIHLTLSINLTATPATPPMLPSKPPAPTRTTTTTTTTTPPPPTTWPPWTGTLPTIQTPTSTPVAPIPDLFNYFAIAVLLVSIGVIQFFSLLLLCGLETCCSNSEVLLLSSKSREHLSKRWRKRPKEIDAEFQDDSWHIGSIFSDSTVSSWDIEKVEPTLRGTRYPKTENSFFERGAFLPKHLDQITNFEEDVNKNKKP